MLRKSCSVIRSALIRNVLISLAFDKEDTWIDMDEKAILDN